MDTYLISHTPDRGDRKTEAVGMPAQSSISARNEDQARQKFAELYPNRTIRAVGILGQPVV